MNKSIFCCFIFLTLCMNSLSAQVVICPSDVTVNSASLDIDYAYGDASINLSEPYTLEESTHVNNMDCNSAFLSIITKTFTVTADDNEVYTCEQLIHVTQSDFSNFTFPTDITIEGANPYNLGTDLTGNVSPETTLEYNHTYDDQIIHVTDDVFKVVRNWTLLNWCTSEVQEHVQIININDANAVNIGNNIFDVNGNLVSWDLFTITDQDGVELDTDVCAVDIAPVNEILNCIYENNSTAESIQLDITKEGDDLNGVSTLDLVLIMRHILNLESFTNYSQVIASQINDDDNVSAIDLVELRNLILGIYEELPTSPSWVFYQADILNADTSSDPQNFDLSFDAAEFPLDAFDILAIKKGDVNGSVDPE